MIKAEHLYRQYKMTKVTHLGVVFPADVLVGHGLQPGLAELGRGGVGLGQAVLKVNQELRVVFVLFHGSRRHENRADALRQVSDLAGEGSFLIREKKRFWCWF